MKLCKDCKYYKYYYDRCCHPKLAKLTTGAGTGAELNRMLSDKCGRDATLFEPKEPNDVG